MIAMHPPVLSDLVDSALVVAMLEESIRCCLTAAAERDGVVLSVEQIARFSREAANNAACPLLLMETK